MTMKTARTAWVDAHEIRDVGFFEDEEEDEEEGEDEDEDDRIAQSET